MKLAIVVAQINRYTYYVCMLTRIQLLAFISSSVPVAMWNVRVRVASLNPSSLNHNGITCESVDAHGFWFIDKLETFSWANHIESED